MPAPSHEVTRKDLNQLLDAAQVCAGERMVVVHPPVANDADEPSIGMHTTVFLDGRSYTLMLVPT